MTTEEYTNPDGNECSHASWLDVQNECRRIHARFDNIKLSQVESAKDSMILWLGYNNDDGNAAFFTLFEEDRIPQNQMIQVNIFFLEQEGYIRHHTDLYQILSNADLGTVVRKVAIYASALQANVAYKLSASGAQDQTPEEYPNHYLVRLTENDKPEQTLCYAWYIEKENNIFLQPVFCEEEEKFFATNRNHLNWEFLHEGDTFYHDNRTYQISLDENNDYYISPLCPVAMRVIKCNP